MPERTTPPSETLYLIDGHAQIFRAFYAIRGGLNSPVTGEPTQAVFGMAGMLLKLFLTFDPQYVVMAIDTKGPTFRDELYADYKANRDAPPADLSAQIPRILDLTRLFGVPIIGQTGAEADDIIATIARRMLRDDECGNIRVRLVSKDKDLEQLLCDRIEMFDIHNDEFIDVAKLYEKKGIRPDQVIDMLAMTGDTVDNVPGVPGIGPKTATTLLQQYGTIEGIYEHIEEIKGKRRENLEAARATIPLSRTLVTLKDDLELDFDLEAARTSPPDGPGLRALFEELGLRRHIADLDRLLDRHGTAKPVKQKAAPSSDDVFAGGLFADIAVSDPVVTAVSAIDETPRREGFTHATDFDYRCIKTRAELADLVATLKQQMIISVDTETIGLGHAVDLCGICLAWKPGHGVYVPVASPTPNEHLDLPTVVAALKPILEDETIGKVGHNLKYDLLALRRAGIHVRGSAFDTMIASFLADAPAHGLDALASALLKHQMTPISTLIGVKEKGAQQKTMDQVPLDAITSYAAEDADITLRLYEHFVPVIEQLGMKQLADTSEMPLVEVLADMQYAGIRVDPAELDRQKTEQEARIVVLRDAIYDAAGGPFNMDSPKQLAEVLFTQLKLPVIKKTKSGPSTDIEVLEKLVDMDEVEPAKLVVPRLMIEYRMLAKLVGTYFGNLKDAISSETGRIHCSFNQTGAATGRLSSNNPNLQNIPIRTETGRNIRKAFVAEPGHRLVCADYSQIELRILAHLSGDKGLKDAFAAGLDIHTAVASQVFSVAPADVSREQRARAKVINFGIIYGITPYGLARRIDGLDVDGAKKLIADYRVRFPGIDTFLQDCVQKALTDGYVSTILGRRRNIREITSSNGQTRTLGERLAINSVVQGSAADLIKLAMVNLHRRINRQALPMTLLLQIHDELVVETPEAHADEAAKIVAHEMRYAMTLDVPLDVEVGVGANWYDAK